MDYHQLLCALGRPQRLTRYPAFLVLEGPEGAEAVRRYDARLERDGYTLLFRFDDAAISVRHRERRSTWDRRIDPASVAVAGKNVLSFRYAATHPEGQKEGQEAIQDVRVPDHAAVPIATVRIEPAWHQLRPPADQTRLPLEERQKLLDMLGRIMPGSAAYVAGWGPVYPTPDNRPRPDFGFWGPFVTIAYPTAETPLFGPGREEEFIAHVQAGVSAFPWLLGEVERRVAGRARRAGEASAEQRDPAPQAIPQRLW